MNLLNDFNSCDNIKLTKRIENYLNIENKSYATQKSLNTNSEHKFEFNFFKLTKILIIDESIVTNEAELNAVLKYCLNKSIQQYNLFQAQNQTSENFDDYEDDFDENDELNIIELMTNFKSNLLNLMHRFSEIFKSLNTFELKKNTLCYYDYMSAYISIYLDVSIELEIKVQNSKLTNIQYDHLDPQDLCLNTFYLLDSCVYYVCNSLLQLRNFKNSKIDFLFPIFHKIIDVKKKSKTDLKLKPKICRSLYTRYLLMYCMLRNATIGSDKIKFFKKFINSYKVPFQLDKFIVKLLTSYADSNETAKNLCSIINKLDSNKKLRNYFMNDLNKTYIRIFITALHNRTLKIKNNHSLSPILNTTEFDLGQASESKVENLVDMNQNDIFEDSCEPEYELEFTSDFSELTQYDVNSLVDQYEEQQQYTPQKQPVDKLNLKTQVVLERIDLKKFHLSSSAPSSSFKTLEKISHDSRQTNSLSKRYEEIARRKSPTKQNISRLNLFRNIYDENRYLDTDSNGDYRCNFNFNYDSYVEYNQAKFYKLNDLVSIMITNNEEKINSSSNLNSTKDLASIYDDCNNSIINNIKSINPTFQNIYDDPKEIINDIELTKNEFKKRKQDFLNKNSKAFSSGRVVDNSDNTNIPVKLIKRSRKKKKFLDNSKTIHSISLTNYTLRNRLPNVWYYD